MATTWKDGSGREWVCRLDIGVANRLRDEKDLNLLDEPTLQRIAEDPFLTVEVMTYCHELDEVSKADFANLCTATESVAIAATDAFYAALANFMRRMRRESHARLIEMTVETIKDADARLAEEMNANGKETIQNAVNRAAAEMRKAMRQATEKANS